ncbi:ABC transporter substrate-binding protein [Chamaesiphon sp. GL140_3_metabinner_50]|uniref:ABC transporter substrate-binding protein n=1 Tax=Chamaesiphon sp. GL140_3_metabinner_50 TaxID=2970812 RepID=UPI0025D252C7|nr:ABC transporter substrate-binding protein [Chamaesiphon sp. GL140_3_metabinner_50]
MNRLATKVGISIALILLVIIAGCTPARRDINGVTHLTLWQGINPPPNRDVFQKLVTKFNLTHPTIEVESLYVGQSDRQLPKILASIVGGTPPDLLWFGSMLTGQLVDLEAIEPLDKWWDRSAIAKDIDPALLGSMQYENNLWSIPFATNNVGIFYRPSLFKAAGIEHLPTNWQELIATAKQLTRDTNGDGKNDKFGMLLPLGQGEWTVFTWLPFMWGGGGELIPKQAQSGRNNPQRVKISIDNPGAIAALQLWQDLIKSGTAILSSPERGYELDNFLTGKVAMQLTGPWTFGQLAGMKFTDYDVMPIPAGIRSATSVGGENLFMMKSSPQHQQAAWEFMEYVLSQEFQTEWALGTGYLPVNLKSRQESSYRDYVSKTPATQVFLDQAKYGRSRPIEPSYSQISEQLGRAIESILLNKNSPQAALKAAQEKLDLSLN